MHLAIISTQGNVVAKNVWSAFDASDAFLADNLPEIPRSPLGDDGPLPAFLFRRSISRASKTLSLSASGVRTPLQSHLSILGQKKANNSPSWVGEGEIPDLHSGQGHNAAFGLRGWTWCKGWIFLALRVACANAAEAEIFVYVSFSPGKSTNWGRWLGGMEWGAVFLRGCSDAEI